MMMEDLDCMLMDVETAFHMEKLKKKYIWKYQWECKKFFPTKMKQMKKTHAINYKKGYMVYVNQQDNSGKRLSMQ